MFTLLNAMPRLLVETLAIGAILGVVLTLLCARLYRREGLLG